jgi:hypothetical protein
MFHVFLYASFIVGPVPCINGDNFDDSVAFNMIAFILSYRIKRHKICTTIFSRVY